MGVPVAVYLRISADKEGRELGVKRQEEDCRAKAESEGDTVVAVYMDNDVSASTRSKKRRPEYERMIADAKRGAFKKIIAYKSSRLTRRPREHEDQIDLSENYGITFDYVASPAFDLNTAGGRAIARMLAVMDANESENNSEQARRKKLQAAQAGEFLGGRAPFGYAPGGMELIPDQARFVAAAYAQLLAGDSLGEIARTLNRAGFVTSHGNEWDSDGVRKLLWRARNAGLSEHDGEIVGPAKWPAIVTESEWRSARALLSDPSRRPTNTGERVYLGSGTYLCGVCDDGTTVRATMTRGSKTAPLRRAYQCRKQAHLVRVAEPVDDMVQRYAVARLAEPDALDLLQGVGQDDLGKLYAEADAIRIQVEEADDDRANGLLDRARWTRITSRLAERMAEIGATLDAATRGSTLAGLAGNPDVSRVWYGEAEDGSDGLSVGRRASVVRETMAVTLLPAPRGRRPDGSYFAPESVRIEWRSID
jgi:DNA invertase Pin-like site-specific DNA recombinase